MCSPENRPSLKRGSSFRSDLLAIVPQNLHVLETQKLAEKKKRIWSSLLFL